MVKFKVTQQVVNRGWKSYVSKDGFIEVDDADVEHFEGFAKFEAPKKKKDESNKKRG